MTSASEATERDGVVEVRRYPNRRLYDTRQKRYVALDEVAATLDAGFGVRVVDTRDGADVTREVLVQLLAQWAEADPALSAELLARAFRARRALRGDAFDTVISAAERVRRADEPRAEAADGSSSGPSVESRLASLEERVAALEAARPSRG